MNKILVWDLPTRVMHWGMALAFLGAFATGDSERFRDLHVMLGYTMAGLVAVRLVWGLVGTRWARFSSFLFGPRALVRYLASLLRGRPDHYVGHNPAGSIAIYMLLALALLASATGFAAYNDLGGEALSELHEGFANTMLLVVIVHVAGVIVSTVLHRENLVAAMITGRKTGDRKHGIRHAHAWLAVLLVAVVAALWYRTDGASLAPVAQWENARMAGEKHHDDDHD